MQPILEGSGSGGGGDHHTSGNQGQPNGDGDSHSWNLVGAILTLVPPIIVGLMTMGVGCIFYQCAFALPAIQRGVADLKSGLADLKSGQDDIHLMVQRLCAALEKPECAFPPNACA